MSFSFEKLSVYQKALNCIDRCETVIEDSCRKMTPSQKDQLSRAAMSVALNIAEANGRWHRAEKRNLFLIARGSIFECAALLQILLRRQKISPQQYKELFAEMEEIGKMLSALIKSTEDLAPSFPKAAG